MPVQALLLLIAAAVLHTAWNYLVKKVRAKQIFTWWTLVIGCVFYIPLIWLHWPIPVQVWPYALASALAETIFFIALLRAYENGDFSLVYPIARGAAPAMLAIWALIFLGERPRPMGAAGLCVLIIGVTIVGGANLLKGRSTINVSLRGMSAALLISFWISVYSTIDGAAVRIMAPQSYAALVLTLTAVFLAPVIFSRYGTRAITAELRENLLRIFAVAFMMLATFIFVLQAFTLSHVSYVAATREMSVILAAFVGWRFMGEEFGSIRTIGSVLIFLGILCIAVAG